MSAGARIFVTLFIFLPYFIIAAQIQSWSLPSGSQLGPVLKFTFIQAVASALFSLVSGLLIALGLAKYRKAWIEIFLLLPSFMPSLFVVISLMNLWQPFPFGYVGTILTHGVCYSGLLGIILFSKFRERLGGPMELAFVEGASRFNILRYLILPALRWDFLNLFIFCFVGAFGSFSIPLLTGKVGALAFEVLVYQKILIEGNMAEAFGLSTLQTLFVFLLMSVYKPQTSFRSFRFPNLSPIGLSLGLVLGLFLSALAIAGLLFVSFRISSEVLAVLPGRILGSYLVGFGTGLLSFFFLALIAYGLPHPLFDKILSSYVSPSSTLVGFSFLLLGFENRLLAPVAITLGILMTILPSLYRLLLADSIKSLKSQMEVAKVLGASPHQIFLHIVFPQCVQPIGILSGVSAFAAIGDFALSRIVAEKSITVAMLIDDLIGSYRLTEATTLVWLLFLIGGSLFWLFRGIGNVFSQKSYSPL